MGIKFVDDFDFDGKRVFLRADLNVPLDGNRNIADDTRIVAVLPTIKYILRNGGRLIIASHLGRPKSEKDEKFSMLPVAEKLAELLRKDVIMSSEVMTDGVKIVANQLKEGELMVLENLRFHPGEKTNDPEFARALASVTDIYVNDAFGVCHRAHASVVGITQYVSEKCAGMLVRKELRYLNLATQDPDRPFLAILGGAKVSDKIGVIKRLLTTVDSICIGGGMAYTFLAQSGIEIGNSLVEKGKLALAKEIMEEAKVKKVNLVLPLDHIAAEKPSHLAVSRTFSNEQGIPENLAGLDIGPETISLFNKYISKAATVFWNGPMGVFEVDKFSKGTMALAQAMAESSGLTIIGGGDSMAAVKKAGVGDKITHISTGGGASLELLEGKVLPGLAALEE